MTDLHTRLKIYKTMADGIKLDSTGLPREIRIFRKGVNATSKGDFTFDSSSAESVLAQYKDQGNKLVFDYEHQTVTNPPMEAPNAAVFVPVVRDGELWATSIKWTDRAREYLGAKEYLYFSPAFSTDDKGRIVGLTSVALTNLPATKNLPTLVAAKASIDAKGYTMTPEIKEALAALMAAMSAEEMPEGEAMKDLLKKALSAYGTEAPAPATEGGEEAALSQVVSLTGKASRDEMLGVIRSWKDSSSKVVALSQRVEQLENEKRAEEFNGLLSSAVKEKKLTPAQVNGEWIGGLRTASNGLVQLKAYLATAPVLGGSVELRQPQAAAPHALTEDEMHYAKKFGITAESMVEHKAKRAAQRNGGI